MIQDFNNRIILIVRKDLEPWQAANTIAHISAFLGNKLVGTFDTGENFITKDGIFHPRNSQCPIIVKRANNNEQLQNLMKKIRESGTLYHGFVREMIDHTNDEDLQSTIGSKDDNNVEYLGIGVFGQTEQVNKLTKKFGLWN